MKQNTYIIHKISNQRIFIIFIFIPCYLNIRICIHKLINYFLDKSKFLVSNSIFLSSRDLSYLYINENYIISIDSNFILRWKYLWDMTMCYENYLRYPDNLIKNNLRVLCINIHYRIIFTVTAG